MYTTNKNIFFKYIMLTKCLKFTFLIKARVYKLT